MSIETQRRRVLSDWRIIMVNQTTSPIMYQIEPAEIERCIEKSRCGTKGYITLRIPIGTRIITKWEEQVRPVNQTDDQWRVVRQWTEAEM